MRKITFSQATQEAMAETMAKDPTVFAMGEDLARQGGIFGQFKGLPQQFPGRIIDTPISETFIIGGGVGAALAGARPVVDMHFADFIGVPMDEIFNQMAKVRYMFGGQAKVPLVLRAPDGSAGGGAAQHSQCVESWFAHIPGIKVVAPSNPYDAKMVLKAAIECDDPVLYFENKILYKEKGEVPEIGEEEPYTLGKARVEREGKDVTIVSYSIGMKNARGAADLLAKEDLGDALWRGGKNAVDCVCYMGYTAWKAAVPLAGQLKDTGMYSLYTDIEMPLIYSLFHMEQEGVKVERAELKEYGDRLKVGIAKLEQEIYQETGHEFNINSPKQLGEILFEQMELPGGKKTKTGYSTAADVLEKLAPDYPVVQKILDYRQLTKLNSTYAEGLAAYIGEDGRIHGKFNQTITATGRISSTEPNLQNIPVRMALGREIRKVFVPKEGCVFVDADYSQIELRILAHMSGDERLIEAYRSAQDIHAITASQVFHVPLDEVTPLQRRNAKAVNFGIVYGISAFGLSEGLSISRKEAVEYIDKYFETYPGVKTFLDGLVKQGKEQGYVTTLYGRRRPIPELKSANFMQRQFGERVAMNSPIQGTAADVMKIAMIAVDRELKKRGLKSRIVLQIHDELLIETARDEIEAVKEILTDKMKHAADLRVSLEVEAEVGKSWFDAK